MNTKVAGYEQDTEHRRDHPTVTIGSTVTIRDVHTGECEVYTLVPPHEADIVQHRISSVTPAGRALYGRRVGEVVQIAAPAGTIRVRIEKIEAGESAPSVPASSL